MMKPKKLLSLFGLWILIWAAYGVFVFFLAHGGIDSGGFVGIPLPTMVHALMIVSIIMSVVWLAAWLFLNINTKGDSKDD